MPRLKEFEAPPRYRKSFELNGYEVSGVELTTCWEIAIFDQDGDIHEVMRLPADFAGARGWISAAMVFIRNWIKGGCDPLDLTFMVRPEGLCYVDFGELVDESAQIEDAWRLV